MKFMIKNRLCTESAELSQAQLDASTHVIANGDVPASRVNNAALAALEAAGLSPFPHDVRVGTIAALVEDAACKMLESAACQASEIYGLSWLSDTCTDIAVSAAGRKFKIKQLEYNLYGQIRELLSDDEAGHYDMRTTQDVQATFLLLAAHSLDSHRVEPEPAVKPGPRTTFKLGEVSKWSVDHPHGEHRYVDIDTVLPIGPGPDETYTRRETIELPTEQARRLVDAMKEPS